MKMPKSVIDLMVPEILFFWYGPQQILPMDFEALCLHTQIYDDVLRRYPGIITSIFTRLYEL